MIEKAKISFNKIFENPLASLFLLLIVSEALYKLFVEVGWSNLKLSASIKILLQVFFIIKISNKNPKSLISIGILFLFFLIGQLGWVPLEQIIKNIIFFDKYLFLLLALLYVNTIIDIKKYYSLFIKCFEGFIIINSIAIFIGFIFHVNYFETYSSVRFGYDGFILRSGAATYIYIIALFFFAHEVFVLKKRKYLAFALTAIATFFIGTKAIIIGWCFLGVFLIGIFKAYKNIKFLLTILIIVLGVIFFVDEISEVVLAKLDFWVKIYREDGLFTAVFSYRDVHLINEMLPLIKEKWTFINYLFGGAYTMHWRSQFGLLDLFFFFGIFGSILYFKIFIKNFITFGLNYYTVIFILTITIVMALSAHFFYETILAFHLIFIKGYFQLYCSKN